MDWIADYKSKRMSTRVGVLLLISALLLAQLSVSHSGCSKKYEGGGRWDRRRAKIDGIILSLLESGRYARALVVCDSLIECGWKDPRVLSQKARALTGLSRFREAIPLFEKAIVDDYENCENHIDFATSLMALGKVGRAITELKVALRFCKGKNRKIALKNLAVAYIKMERPSEARDFIDKALLIDSGNPEILGLKAMLVVDEDPQLANQLFMESLRLDSLNANINYQYAIFLIKSERYIDAIEPLERAVRLSKKQEWQIDLIDVYIKLGIYNEAKALVDQLISQESSEGLLRRKAKILFLTGNYEDALSIYKELPQDEYIKDRIAMCYFNLGNIEEALKWEREALQLNERWVVGLVNISTILAKMGRLDESLEYLKKALELEPENESVKKNLKLLREAMEDR